MITETAVQSKIINAASKRPNLKNLYIWLIALSLTAALCFALTEAFPRHFRLSENILHFLNGLAGFKFFSRRFWFFFSDLCIFSALIISIKKGFIKKQEFFQLEGAFFLYALNLCIFLSLVFSVFSFTYFQLFMAFNFLMTAAYYSLLVSLKDKIYQVMRIVFAGILILAVFQATVGIWQYFSQHSLGLRFLYEPKFSPEQFNVATLSSQGGRLWLFDALFNASEKNQLIARAVGTLPHANNFGAFMFFTILASLYFWFFTRKSNNRKLITVFLFVQVFALFLSFSRAALFALILSTGFFVFYTLLRASYAEKKKVAQITALLFLAVSLSLGLLFFQYRQRGGVISYEGSVKNSDNRRMYYNELSWNILKKYPFLGIGFFAFEKKHPNFISQEIKDKYIDKTVGGVVHNIYLLIATEEGIFALVFFLGFIGFLGYRFFRLPYLLERTLLFSFFLGMLFIGLCDFPYMYMPQGRLFFFLVPGLLSAVNHASCNAQKKTLKFYSIASY